MCQRLTKLSLAVVVGADQRGGGIPTDSFRFRNEIQAGVRYQGVVGPASIYAFGDYIGSGVVNYTGPAITPAEPGVPGTKYNGQTKGISAGFVAADVTISGVTVGAPWQGGQYNAVMATSPKEAVGANAYLIGIQYVTGPFMVGAAYYGFDSQGAVALTGVSQRRENAFGAGGQWQITPGLQAYWEYIYGTRHQGDFNFVTQTAGSKAFNNTLSQALLVGREVGW